MIKSTVKQEVRIDKELQAGLRVTVQMGKTNSNGKVHLSSYFFFFVHQFFIRFVAIEYLLLYTLYFLGKTATGKVVSPSTPREKSGLYWGYSVRMANNLKDMFTECPYEVIFSEHLPIVHN